MSCVSQMIGCLSYSLEWLGVYQPKITSRQAKERLSFESVIWKEFQSDRSEFWNDFQIDTETANHSHPLFTKANNCFQSNGIKKGVAVDLGCGFGTYTFNLLDRGWKVYAVDSSSKVLETLATKVSTMGKNWIENGQLVLVNEKIEEFKFPEKVHLVTAVESLPFCDPEKINAIFLEIKNSLLPQGMLFCNFYSNYDNRIVQNVFKKMFGGWTTTKNVVDALVESIDYKEWSVTEVMNPNKSAKQFHVIVQG